MRPSSSVHTRGCACRATAMQQQAVLVSPAEGWGDFSSPPPSCPFFSASPSALVCSQSSQARLQSLSATTPGPSAHGAESNPAACYPRQAWQCRRHYKHHQIKSLGVSGDDRSEGCLLNGPNNLLPLEKASGEVLQPSAEHTVRGLVRHDIRITTLFHRWIQHRPSRSPCHVPVLPSSALA